MGKGGKENRERGDRAERELIGLLESEGYLVTRSAGSLGSMDMVAFKPFELRLIQCKRSKIEKTKEQFVSLYKKDINKMREIFNTTDKIPDWLSVELQVRVDRKGWLKIALFD